MVPMTAGNKQIVIAVLNNIFIDNHLPGYDMIEPDASIRRAAFPLVTVIIGDYPSEAISYVGRAIELEMYQEGFRMLRQFVTQCTQCLSSIRTEFEAVVRHAFHCDLNDSFEFLQAYLDEETISLYCHCLTTVCVQRNSHFFDLVIDVCQIASKIGDRPRRFLETVFPLLSEIVENGILLSPVHSAFRSFTSTFYSNLFSSTIWSAFAVGAQFEIGWFAFLTYELSQSKEQWRIGASLNGLITFLEFFSDQVEYEFIGTSLSLILQLFPEMKGLIENKVLLYCRLVSLLEGLPRSIMDLLLCIALKVGFDAKTLMKVLEFYDSDLLRLISVDIFNQILRGPPGEQIGLFELFLRKVPAVGQAVLENLPEDDELRFKLARICIRFGQADHWENVETLGLSRLREFGIPLMIDAIEQDVIRVLPKLINAAVHRFVGGDLDYVHVLGLFIGKYGVNKKVSEVLLKLLIDRIADNLDVEESVGLAKKIKDVNDAVVKDVWQTMDQSKRELVQGVLRGVVDPD
jgi:hypothetical protein